MCNSRPICEKCPEDKDSRQKCECGYYHCTEHQPCRTVPEFGAREDLMMELEAIKWMCKPGMQRVSFSQ